MNDNDYSSCLLGLGGRFFQQDCLGELLVTNLGHQFPTYIFHRWSSTLFSPTITPPPPTRPNSCESFSRAGVETRGLPEAKPAYWSCAQIGCEMRGTSALALGCLALLYSLPNAESRQEMEVESDGRRTQRLAVLLTTSNDGDSMQEGRWPTRCSPGDMAANIDLVLYQSDLDNVNSTDPPPEAGSGCFARVRTIHGGQVDSPCVAVW